MQADDYEHERGCSLLVEGFESKIKTPQPSEKS
jgi:hypothetical protein